MKLFGGRAAKLETMNRILTEAARKRAERVEELETRVEYLKQKVDEVQAVENDRIQLIRRYEGQIANAEARLQDAERTSTTQLAEIDRLRGALAEVQAKLRQHDPHAVSLQASGNEASLAGREQARETGADLPLAPDRLR
jgi:chromosome segregation ATPase